MEGKETNKHGSWFIPRMPFIIIRQATVNGFIPGRNELDGLKSSRHSHNPIKRVFRNKLSGAN
jgi:hypothetical protein